MQEQAIINALLHNERYCRGVIPHIKPEYFADGSYQEIFKLISEYINKYSCLPTKEAIIVELNEKKLAEGIHEDALKAVQYSNDEGNAYEWLMDMTEKWAQDRAIYNGIMRSINILDGKDKHLDKGAIPNLLSEALGVCFDTRMGHDYFEDAEAQWEYYRNPENKVSFSIDIMNQVTKGGVTRKTLSIVMAGINVGKTTWLINMAKSYMAQGLNVVYFTLEIGEEVLRERSDVSMMEINFDEMRALEKTPYMNRIKKIEEKTKGKFNIKEFAGGTVHVGHLRHYLNELKAKKGWVPDVIIVDYLTLLLSAQLPRSAKADTNSYYTTVTEELRSLMKEFNAIGWSAAQFNRGGQDADDVGMGDTGLSIGIQATSDFTVAFISPDELGKLGKALGKVLKNRFANKQAIGKFLIGLDNDRQSFHDLDEAEQKAAMDQDEFATFQKIKKPTPTSSKATDWSFGS
jgi:hypothetical protein